MIRLYKNNVRIEFNFIFIEFTITMTSLKVIITFLTKKSMKIVLIDILN